MPAFVVKVTLSNGDLLPPISAMADDESSAVNLVTESGIAGSEGKIEIGGIRDDVMAIAFGEQVDGTIIIRSNWGWSGERPVPGETGIRFERPHLRPGLTG